MCKMMQTLLMEEIKGHVAYLETQKPVLAENISARTLADMDCAVSNLKKGNVSSAIELPDF